MGGRMQTLAESRKSVEEYRQDVSGRGSRGDQWVTKDAGCQNEGRNALVRGWVGGDEWVIQYLDGDEEKVRVRVGDLVRRFTSQTVGYQPSRTPKNNNNEEKEA